MLMVDKKLIISVIMLMFSILSASDTLVLRRGLNGFPGITEASIHSREEGSHAGGSYLKCGSGWC